LKIITRVDGYGLLQTPFLFFLFFSFSSRYCLLFFPFLEGNGDIIKTDAFYDDE